MSITLSEEHLKQLDSFIQEMPVKYGLPIINFLNNIPPSEKETVGEVPGEETTSQEDLPE